jgi:hypothetical protein
MHEPETVSIATDGFANIYIFAMKKTETVVIILLGTVFKRFGVDDGDRYIKC